jgi:hypothetical protein
MVSPFNFNVYLFFNLNKHFKEHLFIKQMSEVQLPTGYKTIDIVSSVYSYKSNSKARIVQNLIRPHELLFHLR